MSHVCNSTLVYNQTGIVDLSALEWEPATLYFLLASLAWILVFKAIQKAVAWSVPRVHPADDTEDADEDGEPDNRHFCYTCAGHCRTKELEILKDSLKDSGQGQQAWALQCASCSRFAHNNDWLPDLVWLCEDYDELRDELDQQHKPMPINPKFPLAKFATKADVLSYIVILFSGLFNAFTITAKFTVEGLAEYNRQECYNFTRRCLATGEFVAVVLALFRMLYLSCRTATKYERRQPFRVFTGLFFANMDMLANANALAAMRWWDLKRFMNTATRSAYVHHAGPTWWDTVLLVLQWLVLIPVIIIMLVGPAAGLLMRLVQLEMCTVIYIADWQATEWVAFLSFLNNFRYLVSQPDIMSRLGHHLMKSRLYFLFSEVMDSTHGFMQLVRCVTLLTTSTPSECYELFKPESNMWLEHVPLVDPSCPTDPAFPQSLTHTPPESHHDPETGAAAGPVHARMKAVRSRMKARRPRAGGSRAKAPRKGRRPRRLGTGAPAPQ